MSFDQFRYASTQRDQEKVSIHLTADQPVPETVPAELQDSIPREEWYRRLNDIKRVSFQFYKPLFERMWMLMSFFAVIILPMLLYNLIFKALTKNTDGRIENRQQLYQARMISFGIFVGTVAVFWGPLLIWKLIGKRRIRVMLNRWTLSDREMKGTTSFIPLWTVDMPSVFRSTTIVCVSIPPGSRPSVFHPAAYIPTFVNAPRDSPGGAYYYPYAPGQSGVPRMSVVGNMGGPPAYSGVGEYKAGYGDVKV